MFVAGGPEANFTRVYNQCESDILKELKSNTADS